VDYLYRLPRPVVGFVRVLDAERVQVLPSSEDPQRNRVAGRRGPHDELDDERGAGVIDRAELRGGLDQHLPLELDAAPAVAIVLLPAPLGGRLRGVPAVYLTQLRTSPE
jgi:hypothetical protein